MSPSKSRNTTASPLSARPTQPCAADAGAAPDGVWVADAGAAPEAARVPDGPAAPEAPCVPDAPTAPAASSAPVACSLSRTASSVRGLLVLPLGELCATMRAPPRRRTRGSRQRLRSAHPPHDPRHAAAIYEHPEPHGPER